MVFFMHGDNLLESRNELNRLIDNAKNRGVELIRIDGEKTTLNEIIQTVESSSLFGMEKLVVCENLFSKRQSKDKKEIIDWFKKADILVDVIFWERKKVSGHTIRWLPKKWEFKEFKTPAIIFKFLDSLKPKNNKTSLQLMRQVIKSKDAEMVFYMLAKRWRNLIVAKTEGKKELYGAPWQKARLMRQAEKFSRKKLAKIYENLLNIDIGIKTGASIMPLDWQLDIMIANMI